MFKRDIPHVVRMLDNVIDRTIYPLGEQEAEAKSKRRIGIGVTGEANALEALEESMRSYIKIYGPPIVEAIRELERIAIDMPEVCIMDYVIAHDISKSIAKVNPLK